MAPKSSESKPSPSAKGDPPKPDGNGGDDDNAETVTPFSPEEEASLVTESNAHKTEANALFTSSKYEPAIAKYNDAVAVCPNYLDYEVAVLKSNIAACHLKLEEWKEAISAATASLSRLDKIDEKEAATSASASAEQTDSVSPDEGENKKPIAEHKEEKEEEEEEEVEAEIISTGAAKAAPAPKAEKTLSPAEAARLKRQEDVLRIRAKALMRRARARSEQGGWSNLAGAEEDYKALSGMTNLGGADRRVVQLQLRALPARVEEAKTKEMSEMWGKLKELGNGILKPFGLSTENFKMVQDEKTGGYSMNFQGNSER